MKSTMLHRPKRHGFLDGKAGDGAGPRGASLTPPAAALSIAGHVGGTMPAVQAKGRLGGSDVHRIAAAGTVGAGRRLPFLDTIQRLFGPDHDLSTVRAHVGGPAAMAGAAIGAKAYAMGSHVAFSEEPDLRTAAHEAAHVMQQTRGVNLLGGVGRPGDVYEQHADRVAEHVVAGRSAEGLLATMGGLPSGMAGDSVQALSTGASTTGDLLEGTNAIRAANGAGPLRRNAALDAAAQAHADDMAARRTMSHTGSDGSTASVRAKKAGYTTSDLGENIGLGFRSPGDVLDAWLASPGHSDNLLNPAYMDTGTGYADGPNGPYWCQVFGAR